MREGDTVVVWKLDRLGRYIKDLIEITTEFKQEGVDFVRLQEHTNTNTPAGEMTFHIFAALAQFEKSMISDRTKSGLKSAVERGRLGGRPKGLSEKSKEKARVAKELHHHTTLSVPDILKQLKLSKSTFYRYLKS